MALVQLDSSFAGAERPGDACVLNFAITEATYLTAVFSHVEHIMSQCIVNPQMSAVTALDMLREVAVAKHSDDRQDERPIVDVASAAVRSLRLMEAVTHVYMPILDTDQTYPPVKIAVAEPGLAPSTYSSVLLIDQEGVLASPSREPRRAMLSASSTRCALVAIAARSNPITPRAVCQVLQLLLPKAKLEHPTVTA